MPTSKAGPRVRLFDFCPWRAQTGMFIRHASRGGELKLLAGASGCHVEPFLKLAELYSVFCLRLLHDNPKPCVRPNMGFVRKPAPNKNAATLLVGSRFPPPQFIQAPRRHNAIIETIRDCPTHVPQSGERFTIKNSLPDRFRWENGAPGISVTLRLVHGRAVASSVRVGHDALRARRGLQRRSACADSWFRR